ncbi:MAG: methionyl-tRNA formyltransferase-like protein [Anaerolineaceae bacterium]|nr:methionyl-tRNA formyltransferase-like protein [Anaerolineaceae bacterium]
MRIALLCATRRGYRFLEKLSALAPEHDLTVFSFRETPWEPPFLEAIADLSRTIGAQFIEARSVSAPELRVFWDETPLDLMFTVSWRYLIPADIYQRPRLGAFVFHDSLLPTYRGFSPTVWAMMNGEDHTGVTLFEMADDVDSGDIVAQKRVPIGETQAIGTVMEKVTDAYLDLLAENLPALLAGTASRTPQHHEDATFTCKLLPEDHVISWTDSTPTIYNLIRAVSAPYPGAFTTLNGQKLTIWEAEKVIPQPDYVGRIPGRVVSFQNGKGAEVLTGDGVLRLIRVQLEGEPIQPAEAVLNRIGYTLGR